MALPASGRTIGLPVLGDERLARLVADGNERAFNTLFRRYHQQLYRYCHSMVRHDADAQDALQSTFTSALVALRRRQRDAPLRPWLFRIAHNESVSLLRRRRPGDELSDELASSRPTVEESAQERAELAQLVADMQMLPERQRGALVMRELNGLSHEELAQVLGVSVGAAKQTVFEARRALQQFADGRAMSCEEIQRTVSDRDRRALRGRRVHAHLRECSTCSSFVTAIPERRTALMALSPALPAVAASGLLARIAGAGSAQHGGGGGLLAGATGKSVGVAMSAKTLATGAAIVATAAASVGAVEIAAHSIGSTRFVGRSDTRAPATAGSGAAPARGSKSAGTATAGRHRSGAGPNSGSSSRGAHHTSAGDPRKDARLFASTRASSGSTTARRSVSGHGQGSGAGNPSTHGGNLDAGGGSTTNPNAHGGNPNAGGGSTTNPNAHGGNPNAHGGNPNARGGKPKAWDNPNAHGGNPNAGGPNHVTHQTNPNAHGGNPNAHGNKQGPVSPSSSEQVQRRTR